MVCTSRRIYSTYGSAYEASCTAILEASTAPNQFPFPLSDMTYNFSKPTESSAKKEVEGQLFHDTSLETQPVQRLNIGSVLAPTRYLILNTCRTGCIKSRLRTPSYWDAFACNLMRSAMYYIHTTTVIGPARAFMRSPQVLTLVLPTHLPPKFHRPSSSSSHSLLSSTHSRIPP